MSLINDPSFLDRDLGSTNGAILTFSGENPQIAALSCEGTIQVIYTGAGGQRVVDEYTDLDRQAVSVTTAAGSPIGIIGSVTELKIADTLSAIDLRALRSLEYLDLSGQTTLTGINLFGCRKLEYLDMSGCSSLSVLDLKENVELQTLILSGCSSLLSLKLDNNTKLQTVDLTDCSALSYLDATMLTELQTLTLDGTQLDSPNNTLILSKSIYDGSENRTPEDGMGYIVLRKDKTFAEQVTKENTIYEIRYDFDLAGETVTIPAGCVLKFEGGKLLNGDILGNNTRIEAQVVNIFDEINCSGSWLNDMCYPEWFGAKGDEVVDDTDALINSISFACANNSTLKLGKQYLFTKPITISQKITIECEGRLMYDGVETEGYALTLGNRTAITSGFDVSIKLIHKRVELYGINGLCCVNTLHGTFKVNVQNFADGFTLLGANMDCDYNLVYPIYLGSNRRNIVLTTLNTGYVNQNTFIGGSCRVDSNVAPMIQDGDAFYSVYLSNYPNAYLNNNNTFIGVSFECITPYPCYVYTEGRATMYINCRYENVKYKDSERNQDAFVLGGFGFRDNIEEIHATNYITKDEVVQYSKIGFDLKTESSGSFNLYNSNGVKLFSINGIGEASVFSYLTANSIIRLTNTHSYPSNIIASDNIPTSNMWDGSLHLSSKYGGNRTGVRLHVRDGGVWKEILYSHSATTRPTDITAGYMMFDVTLGKPIWWDGANWVDATGTAV